MGGRQGPQSVPAGALGGIFRGLTYPLAGLDFIRRNQLWGAATVPIAVNVLLFGVLIFVSGYFVLPWLREVDQALLDWFGTASVLMTTLGSLVSWSLWVLAWLLLVAVNTIVLLLVGQAVASPFLDALSERVETKVLGTPPPKATVARVVRSIVMAVADIIWTVMYWVGLNAPLLILNFVPGLGTTVATIGSFFVTALLLAQEFVGLSLSRQLVSYPARWRVVWANRWLACGFGATTMGLLIIPGLNLILLPLAAVGGTLLYCDLRAAGRIELLKPVHQAA